MTAIQQLNPHLSFDGRCREAFAFYAELFGGKTQAMLTYGESPLAATTRPEHLAWILHATLTFGHHTLTGADVGPKDYQRPQGFSVLVNIADPAETERIFAGLASGGTVQFPLQRTFWAQRFGMAVDRFGIPWIVNCND